FERRRAKRHADVEIDPRLVPSRKARAGGMTSTARDEVSEDRFMQIVATIRASDPSLTAVGSALLAAHHLGIANDSRTFSRKLGIAHALVLREISAIAGEDGYLS